MNDRSLGNARANEGSGLAHRIKNCWHRIAGALRDDDDDLSFPILIAGISAVAAVFFLVCWFYITSKIAAIYLGDFALTADDTAFISSAIASRGMCRRTNADS
jgi:hypothetical protein